MITEDEIERHLDALERLGEKSAIARADADHADQMLKTVYAHEYLKSDLPRTADREAAAYASEAYKAALTERRETFIAAEKMRHERAWRERIIDAWQTMSANKRGKI